MKIIVLFGYFLLYREIYCCLLTLVFLNRAVCILISVHDRPPPPPTPTPPRVYASTGITLWKLLVGIWKFKVTLFSIIERRHFFLDGLKMEVCHIEGVYFFSSICFAVPCIFLSIYLSVIYSWLWTLLSRLKQQYFGTAVEAYHSLIHRGRLCWDFFRVELLSYFSLYCWLTVVFFPSFFILSDSFDACICH